MNGGKQAKIVRHSYECPGLSEFVQGRLIDREPFFKRGLLCDDPCPHKRAPRPVIVEPIFPAEAARFLSDPKRRLRLASELMHHREVIERNRHTEGVRDFPCDRKPFLGGLQGAVGKAEMPVAMADI